MSPTKAQLQAECDRLTLELALHAECDPDLADRCRRAEGQVASLHEVIRLQNSAAMHMSDAQKHLLAAYGIASKR